MISHSNLAPSKTKNTDFRAKNRNNIPFYYFESRRSKNFDLLTIVSFFYQFLSNFCSFSTDELMKYEKVL